MKKQYKKANTCKFCLGVGKLGGAFVTASCKSDRKIYIKQKGFYALLAKNCESCKGYEKKERKNKYVRKTQKGYK